MSSQPNQQFNARLISLVGKGFALLLVILALIICLVLSFETGLLSFFFAYLCLVSLAIIIGLKLYADYSAFKKNMFYLDVEKGLTVDLSDADLALKVCLFYRNGASYSQIKQEFGFERNVEVRRKLIQGLTVLFKEYKKSKGVKE